MKVTPIIAAITLIVMSTSQTFAQSNDSMVMVERQKTQKIDRHGVCRMVENIGPGDAMIPVRTSSEWAVGQGSFLKNQHDDLVVTACACAPEARTYVQSQILDDHSFFKFSPAGNSLAAIYESNGSNQLRFYKLNSAGNFVIEDAFSMPLLPRAGVTDFVFSGDGSQLKVLKYNKEYDTYQHDGSEWRKAGSGKALFLPNSVYGKPSYTAGSQHYLMGSFVLNHDGSKGIYAQHADGGQGLKGMYYIMNTPSNGDWTLDHIIDPADLGANIELLVGLYDVRPGGMALNKTGDVATVRLFQRSGMGRRGVAVYKKTSETWSNTQTLWADDAAPNPGYNASGHNYIAGDVAISGDGETIISVTNAFSGWSNYRTHFAKHTLSGDKYIMQYNENIGDTAGGSIMDYPHITGLDYGGDFGYANLHSMPWGQTHEIGIWSLKDRPKMMDPGTITFDANTRSTFLYRQDFNPFMQSGEIFGLLVNASKTSMREVNGYTFAEPEVVLYRAACSQ